MRIARHFPSSLSCIVCLALVTVDRPALILNAQNPEADQLQSGKVPSWSQELRLVGVTALGGCQMAYFSDASSTNFFLLCVGETFDGIKLHSIEKSGDSQDCRVVVSRNHEQAVINLGRSEAPTVGKTIKPPPQEDAPEDRVAVRPWRKPKAPRAIESAN